MLPTFIRSALEFQSTVQFGRTPESLVLEFKATINGWNTPVGQQKKKAQKETCRDIAQFANTLGGCLLVGVHSQFDQTRGVNVADSIASVNQPEQLWQWIEQAIVNYLVPTTVTHDIVPIALTQGNVLAVNVPASRHLVSLWDRDNHTVEYVRRTSHGKEWMNPDEAERHLMDGSRAAKLALIAAIEHATPAQRVKLAGGLWQEYAGSPGRPQQGNPPGPITFGQIGEYWFELRMQHKQKTCSVTIPYGLIKEAWVDISGTVTLLLAVRVIMRHDELTLEPYV